MSKKPPIMARKLMQAANPFDVILMDVQIPEMDGFQATKIIRETMGTTSDCSHEG